MGFNTRGSQEQVISTGQKWTGLCNMTVKAVNPTMEQMKALSMNPQKEPEYNVEFEDKTTGEKRKSYRLDIYLHNAEKKINAKIAFFLEDKIRYNRDGSKVEWINKFGTSAWSNNETTPPQYDWFNTEGARPALVGESNLTEFLSNWANTSNEDPCCLDDPSALAKGNINEIRAIHNIIPNNEIQVLLVVDGQYQAVYNGKFDRPYRKAFDQWKKAVNNPNTKPKGEYGNSFELRPYQPSPDMTPDNPNAGSFSSGQDNAGNLKF